MKKKTAVAAPRRAVGNRKSKRSKASTSHKGFASYQKDAAQTIHGKFRDQSDQIASMLGLASETGSILDSYKRYLRDAIDLNLNREFLRVELGDLLWYVAVVATACGLSMAQIANANLARVRARYKRKFPSKTADIGCRVPLQTTAPTDIAKDFASYQFEASRFSELNLRGPDSLIAPLCGLAAKAGSILGFLRDEAALFDLRAEKKFFLTELGDLLWYLSAVATASNLNLGDIAQDNLVRARDLYPVSGRPLTELFKTLPRLNEPHIPEERFPRRILVKFEEETSQQGHPVAKQTIVYAEPNAFPSGQIMREGKKPQGFAIGRPLGNQTDDNSRRADGYRYHDAIHMGFMAVLGWSPTMRSLLRLKRKSESDTDRTEDGARAEYTEEGLAAILARLAPRCMDFQGESAVNGEIIDTAQALVQDTEVQSLPGWLWRRAISQGFVAMHQLTENRGGYLLADLDARTLTYSKVKPDVTAKKRHQGTARSKEQSLRGRVETSRRADQRRPQHRAQGRPLNRLRRGRDGAGGRVPS